MSLSPLFEGITTESRTESVTSVTKLVTVCLNFGSTLSFGRPGWCVTAERDGGNALD